MRWTHVPEQLAVAIATILIAAFVTVFLVLFGSRLSAQIVQVIQQLPHAIDAAGGRLGISNAFGQLQEAISSTSGPTVLSRAAGLGYNVIRALADIVLVIFAAVYLAADPGLYRRGVVLLLPSDQHPRALDAMDVTGNDLRLWFAGQLVSMLLVGIASELAYWWIGLPSPLALAIIAGATNFVPFIGPIFGSIPTLVFALSMGLDAVL